MGILYSQPSSLEEQKTKAAANNYTVKGRYDARDSDRNNNAEHVVIIPMDLSKHAEGAFEWYVNNMHKEGNIVRIIHCQEVNILPYIQNPKEVSVDETIIQARKGGKSLIEKYEEKLRKYGIPGSVHSEYSTSPGELIIFSVDRYHGNQVVMGSRGLGIVRRSILGSVSQYVLDHSRVPVTVIPRDSVKSWFI